MPGPRPQLVALLLCDRAFQEVGNMRWHISGAFDTVCAAALPFTHPQLSVFVALSDFRGDQTVELVMRDQEGAVVKAVRGKIPRIPLGLFQSVFPFPAVEFRTEGVHTLELFAGGDLVALRSFRVKKSSVDPTEASRQANELTEQHSAQLVADARELWTEHPDVLPVGLIVSADAAAMPWLRERLQTIFESATPMACAGLVDRDTALRILEGKVSQPEEWLESGLPDAGRVLPVVIVLKGSFQLVHLAVET
jgi:hypothetical protein